MIKIEITAETGTQARAEMIDLLTGAETDQNTITYEWTGPAGLPGEVKPVEPKVQETQPAPATEEKKTRTRAPKTETTTVAPEPTPEVTPTASPVDDLLGSPAPVTPTPEPVLTTIAPDPFDAPPAQTKPQELTIEKLRHKISAVALANRPAVKEKFAEYKKADGTQVEKADDLQEKDFQDFYDAIDRIVNGGK